MCASGLVRVREWVSGCVAVVCACVFVEVPVCGCARACVVGVKGGVDGTKGSTARLSFTSPTPVPL